MLDGATGTELERRGVATDPPLWSAAALIACPDTVAAIHRDYADAGADILVANTFRTNARALRAAGRLDEGAALNRLAIELAHRAARGQTLVAASVAPVEDCYRPDLGPDETTLRREHKQMASWLRDAGSDLVWIETIGTIREARAAVAAIAAAGLPLAVSFTTREDGALLGGEALEDAVAAIEPFDPIAIGVNCIPPDGVTAILPRLRRATNRPLAAYAHVNNDLPTYGWSFSQHATPEEYANCVRRWLELGARIVGGCCGTTPRHIQAVRRSLDASEPDTRTASDVTRILSAIERGDAHAAEELLPVVYEELRKLAAQRLANEAPGHTLQPTALVHEAYLRLVSSEDDCAKWSSRGHFFGAAAEAMRRILIDRARARGAQRRGGGWRRLRLDEVGLTLEAPPAELLDLDEALEKLAGTHPRQAELVKLRFFAGLTTAQAAQLQGIATRTAEEDWTYARAWLYAALSDSERGGNSA